MAIKERSTLIKQIAHVDQATNRWLADRWPAAHQLISHSVQSGFQLFRSPRLTDDTVSRANRWAYLALAAVCGLVFLWLFMIS